MRFVAATLAGTPIWVYALLGLLVWQGVRALKPAVVPVGRVLAAPAVLLVLGLSRLASASADGPWPAAAWLAACLLFAPVGVFTGPRLLAADKPRRRVLRAGSPATLLRNVSVFLVQYVSAVYAAMHPGDGASGALASRAAFGAVAGYLIGWAAAFARSYLGTPSTDLAAGAPAGEDARP